jgi:hypothetical protein
MKFSRFHGRNEFHGWVAAKVADQGHRLDLRDRNPHHNNDRAIVGWQFTITPHRYSGWIVAILSKSIKDDHKVLFANAMKGGGSLPFPLVLIWPSTWRNATGMSIAEFTENEV